MNNHYDVIVIGGGIVGLATAFQTITKNSRLRILLLEKESDVAQHQTGHNSGVLHSGIYYTPGSLKARNCVTGYQMMVQFCREHCIPFDICGKVIVAVKEEERPFIQSLMEKGIANGLQGIRKLSAEELREREPHVSGIEGLFVPQTGITDFTRVASAMKELLIKNGVALQFNEEVYSIQRQQNVTLIRTGTNEYTGKVIVSCAGLHSDRVARMTYNNLPLRILPFRGEYYKLKESKRHLVKNLIYPVPDPAFPFLGVHFTRTITGEVEAGPNAVFAFAREGYSRTSFNFRDAFESLTWPGFHRVAVKYWRTGAGEYYRSFNKSAFTKALQKLIPEIQEKDLEEGGSGVRAQACDHNGNLLNDFSIMQENDIIHVCNAPSPAATSSLAIGEYLAGMVIQHVL
ncbi:MAG: L-2-hydroxyglutarate oxidase [Bacteroidota bacterium]